MTIEMLTAYGANTKEGLHRCMNNEDFYLRLVKTVSGDANFQRLYDAVEAGDIAAAFEAAHALKGSTGNLALTPLFVPICEITELLRARTEMDYAPLLTELLEEKAALDELCAE